MHLRHFPEIQAVLNVEGRPEFVILKRTGLQRLMQSLEVQGAIDEEDYLRRYPDVARAVAQGKFSSATEHYVKAGYSENRIAKILP